MSHFSMYSYPAFWRGGIELQICTKISHNCHTSCMRMYDEQCDSCMTQFCCLLRCRCKGGSDQALVSRCSPNHRYGISRVSRILGGRLKNLDPPTPKIHLAFGGHFEYKTARGHIYRTVSVYGFLLCTQNLFFHHSTMQVRRRKTTSSQQLQVSPCYATDFPIHTSK